MTSIAKPSPKNTWVMRWADAPVSGDASELSVIAEKNAGAGTVAPITTLSRVPRRSTMFEIGGLTKSNTELSAFVTITWIFIETSIPSNYIAPEYAVEPSARDPRDWTDDTDGAVKPVPTADAPAGVGVPVR